MKRGASMAKMFGLSVDVIGPAEIKAKYPLLSLDGVVGGVFLPKDGQANPVDVTQAYAKGARMGGARVVEGIEVERILLEGGRAVGVVTEQGNCAPTRSCWRPACGRARWARRPACRCRCTRPSISTS